MDKNITCDAYSFQHTYAKPKNVSFHLFPKDRKMRDRWIEAIGAYRKGYVPSKTSVLCSEHFVESDYTSRGQRLILRLSSVPTIFDFTCVKKQKAIDNHQIPLTEDNKFKNSYKSYRESLNATAAAQLNLKLKPELLALLHKRNRPILLRRKTKETGSKKQIPESIWIMPSGSLSTSPRVLIPPNCSRNINPFERPRQSIKVVIPKVPPNFMTDFDKNNKKSKPNPTQLSPEEFVKEEPTIDSNLNDRDIIEIQELIKQEHEYCIKVERPEIVIKKEPPNMQEIPEDNTEFPFRKCELVNQNKAVLRVKTASELIGNEQNQIENTSKQIENASKQIEDASKPIENASKQIENASKQIENASKQIENTSIQVENVLNEIKQEPQDVDDVYEANVIQERLNAIKKEPETIIPELTAELMEQGEDESEYFEFVDVDMNDDMDYPDDPLQIREELILS